MIFQSEKRVEFRDTDAAGIAHFSAFFIYMEQAEHAFWRSLGHSVMHEDADGKISWPRVSAHCDYSTPARFEEILQIEVSIARLGRKSVTYDFTFSRDQLTIARGTMTSVCCRIAIGQPPRSIEIPAELARQLQPYVSDPSAA